jgi:hypothetical protein
MGLVVGVGNLVVLACDLIGLIDDPAEGVAPAIDRMLHVLSGDGPGFLGIVALEIEIGSAVVELHLLSDLAAIDFREHLRRFLDAILQQEVIGNGVAIVVV